MFQLAILPGPKSPKDLDSFLKPIIDEFKDLSEHGLVVRKNGKIICEAKVNLVIATGDIPAAASLSHHAGHMSKNGCRFCKIVTKHIDKRNCFLEINAEMRDKSDFILDNQSTVSVY